MAAAANGVRRAQRLPRRVAALAGLRAPRPFDGHLVLEDVEDFCDAVVGQGWLA